MCFVHEKEVKLDLFMQDVKFQCNQDILHITTP